MPSSRPRARLRQGVTEEDESETETETESEPPPYSAIAQTINPKAERTKPSSPPPPPYTSPFHPPPSPNPKQPPKEKEEQEEQGEQDPQPPYTIHHLRHPPHPSPDSLTSLSLRYGIPAHILRQHNSLPNDADYLLAARHTLLIPTAYITTKPNTTTNPSLSPHPPGDAASRERKVQIRRFMVACKEADYDAAVVYLEASGHDFDEAVARHRADAAWERANPNPSPSRNSLGGSGGGSRGKGVCRGEEGRGAWGMGMGMVGETGKGKAVVKAGGGGEAVCMVKGVKEG